MPFGTLRFLHLDVPSSLRTGEKFLFDHLQKMHIATYPAHRAVVCSRTILVEVFISLSTMGKEILCLLGILFMMHVSNFQHLVQEFDIIWDTQ